MVGSQSTQSFDFTADYDSNGFALAHGEEDISRDLNAGTYSVSETVPDGWRLSSAVCDDESPVSAIELSDGETVTCTFYNVPEDQPLPPEVGASILVTVNGVCIVEGANGIGQISVTMSVPGGATVVISDSGGDVVGTLTEDGTISVPEGDTYAWAATANDGFEFPSDFTPSGTVAIETCSSVEVLPFTGVYTDELAALGIVLMFAGALTLFAVRRRGEEF